MISVSHYKQSFGYNGYLNLIEYFQVNKSYKEHQNEMLKKKDMLKKQIVKQKYFKENTPNLLTWSEKEQIRYLHNKDPVGWTLEKLSDSFPMTVATAEVTICKYTLSYNILINKLKILNVNFFSENRQSYMETVYSN